MPDMVGFQVAPFTEASPLPCSAGDKVVPGAVQSWSPGFVSGPQPEVLLSRLHRCLTESSLGFNRFSLPRETIQSLCQMHLEARIARNRLLSPTGCT